MRRCLVLTLLFYSLHSLAQPRDLSAGFSFLDTLLQNKRVVLLGESSHGTEEYSRLKSQLIQYLHEKLGYKVLLFESPMTNAAYVNSSNDSPAVTVRNSIQSVWHTNTVSELFRYVKSSQLFFNGFDPQFMDSPYPSLLYSEVFADLPAIKTDLFQLESRIAATVKDPSAYLSLRDSFATAYARLAQQMSNLPLTPAQQWLQQVCHTNSHYYKRITKGDQRDSCMANNIIWLANHLYANEKIIIWAHNTHIDKSPNHKRIMGKLLAAHFKDSLYAIGLYMMNGATALNNRKVITVKPPIKGSLEMVLAESGFTYTYMPVSALNRRMPTWHWGKDKQVINPAKSYDAVILINGVQAPDYLSK